MKLRSLPVSAGLLAILTAATTLACLSPPFVGNFRPWPGSTAFVKGLRCQMTEADLRHYAEQFPKILLHKPDSLRHVFFAEKGDTLIRLGLQDGLLQTYHISWTSGFTRSSSRLKYDLCKRRYLVHMWLVSSSEYGGAAGWLDGVLLGQLSESGGFVRDIPLGVHEFRIEAPGVGVWVIELRYDKASQGHDRIPIEVMTKLE